MACNDGLFDVGGGDAAARGAGGKGQEIDDEEAQQGTNGESQGIRFLEANRPQGTRHGRF